jgi:acylphosphatase
VTPDSPVACAHFRVRGQVQGVFYRASTEAVALRLGLSGWVRNCEDGDVEVLACGALPQLDALEKWLWQGPARARVGSVHRSPVPLQVFDGFEVRR